MPTYIWNYADAPDGRSAGSATAHKQLVSLSNGLRSYCNMSGFDETVDAVADKWIQQMEELASDIYTRCSAYSTREAPFTPGDLLKTPSRKRALKKSKIASKGLASTPMQDDKENVPHTHQHISPSPPKPAPPVSRSTRSRADQSSLIPLPNPYESRKTKSRRASAAKKQSTKDASSSSVLSGDGIAVSSPRTKTNLSSATNIAKDAKDHNDIIAPLPPSPASESSRYAHAKSDSTKEGAARSVTSSHLDAALSESTDVVALSRAKKHLKSSDGQESIFEPNIQLAGQSLDTEVEASSLALLSAARSSSPMSLGASVVNGFQTSSPGLILSKDEVAEDASASFTLSTGDAVSANEPTDVSIGNVFKDAAAAAAAAAEVDVNDNDIVATGVREEFSIVEETRQSPIVAPVVRPPSFDLAEDPTVTSSADLPRVTPVANQYRSSLFIKTLERKAIGQTARDDDSDSDRDDTQEPIGRGQVGRTDANTIANSGVGDAVPKKRKSDEMQSDNKKVKIDHASTASYDGSRTTKGTSNLASLRERLDLAARASTTQQQGRATVIATVSGTKTPLWTSRSSSTASSRDASSGMDSVVSSADVSAIGSRPSNEQDWEDEDENEAFSTLNKSIEIKETNGDFVTATRAATSVKSSEDVAQIQTSSAATLTRTTAPRSPSKLPLLRSNSAVLDLVEKFEQNATASTSAWSSPKTSRLPVLSPLSPYKAPMATAQTTVNATTAEVSTTPAKALAKSSVKSPAKVLDTSVESAATQRLAVIVQAHNDDLDEDDEAGTASEASEAESKEDTLDFNTAVQTEPTPSGADANDRASGPSEKDTDAELLGSEKSDAEDIAAALDEISSDPDINLDDFPSDTDKKRLGPASIKPPKGNMGSSTLPRPASSATLRSFPSSAAAAPPVPASATSTSAAAPGRSAWGLSAIKGILGMSATPAAVASTTASASIRSSSSAAFMPTVRNTTRPAFPGSLSVKTSKPTASSSAGSSTATLANKAKSSKLAEQTRKQEQAKKDARARPLVPDLKKREREQEREAGPGAKSLQSFKAGASSISKAPATLGPAKKKLRLTPETETAPVRSAPQHNGAAPRPPKGKLPVASALNSASARAVENIPTIRPVGIPSTASSGGKGFDLSSQPIRFDQAGREPSTTSAAGSKKQVARPPNPFQKQHAPSHTTAPTISRSTQPLVSREPTPEAELEEIDSEYSDSGDEATQRKRARDAPWTRGPELLEALAAQEPINADAIFGYPDGDVPIAAMLRTGGQMRPRSSSANWSGPDGLTQREIDEDNQRRGILGPRVLLPPMYHATNGSASGRRPGGGAGFQASGAGSSRASHATSNGSLF